MKIREIELHTTELDLLRHFYSKTLELPMQHDSATEFAVQAGQSVLRFRQVKSSEKPYYHFAFNIPQNQISEAQNWARDRVELIAYKGHDVVDFPNWNAHSVYFFDPTGNVVELIARHDLPNASEKPFGPRSLLCISEIGLPVDDVADVAEKVKKKLGVPYFRSYSSDDFTALGDDEGLLLIVSQNRQWLPTENNSKMFPVRVVVEGKKSLSLAPLPHEIEGGL